MEPIRDRELTVEFGNQLSSDMCWKFYPIQHKIKVVPGETALAFYKAYNPSDRPITGIATYSILPIEATKYFHKIQVLPAQTVMIGNTCFSASVSKSSD